ncbi:hypothetical protein Adt_18794 [Abeliophyllum distichum]|uniref:Uncharacterized protein n=1 Tax=Abeliophyllum distichum TaxID=126358 RepID=A0ABD1TKD1_9LAMI
MVTKSNDDPNFVDFENDIDEDDDLAYEKNVLDDIQIETESRVSKGTKDIGNEVDELEYPTSEELRSDYENLNVLSGSSASSPVLEGMSKGNTEAPVIITEEVGISTMVDELEQLESEEAIRNRA